MSLASRIAHGPTPPQMPQDTRCEEVLRSTRCDLPAGHAEAFHRAGERTWGFRDTRPDWVVRALQHRLPYRVEGGAER